MKTIFLLIFITTNAYGYVISKDESGRDIRWIKNNNYLNIEINPMPVQTNIILDIASTQLIETGLSKSEYISYRTKQLIQESLNEWNNVSPYKIITKFVSGNRGVGSGINTFRYTDDYRYFGSGVIAITSISYSSTGGNILSADILMNQSSSNFVQFTLDNTISSKDYAFVGDIFTHEFGHFLGLSHSEVIGSSMVYSVFKGQHSIHDDDAAGVKKIYKVSTQSGTLKGRVIAGRDITPVFGTNVYVLDVDTNDVIQSQTTDLNGDFFIEHLDLERSYYIMVSPLKKLDSVPDYFKNLNNEICGGKDFDITFFVKCGARGKSRPQAFKLSSSNNYINVGDITIRCDENINTSYFGNKYKTTNREYELLENYYDNNFIFFGFFSDTETLAGLTGSGDEFTVDLRSVDPGNYSLGNVKLDLNLNSTGIGSIYDFVVYAKKTNDVTWTTYTSTTDSDGKRITDLNLQLNLSSTAGDNLFQLIIHPITLSSADQYAIFSAPKELSNNNNLYSISGRVGVLVNSKFQPFQSFTSYPYDDNRSCAEGEIVYNSKPYTSMSTSVNNSDIDQTDKLGISCATIDIDNGSGPSDGMGSFVLGFMMIFLLVKFNNFSHNTLSNS